MTAPVDVDVHSDTDTEVVPDTEVIDSESDTVDSEVVLPDTDDSGPVPRDDDAVVALAPTLWLRADDVLGVADRGELDVWPAHRGIGPDVTAPTPAMRPELRTQRVNGEPMVRFDGIDDRLTVPVDPFSLNPGGQVTVFAVVSTEDRSGLLVGRSANVGGAQDVGIVLRDGRPELRVVADSAGVVMGTTAPAIDDLRWRVLSGIVRGRTSALFLDGELVGATAQAPPAVDAGPVTIGGGYAPPVEATSTPLDVDIAEVLVFSRALTTCERWAVESYLSTHYALPVVQRISPPSSRYLADDLATADDGASVPLWQEHAGWLPPAGALAMAEASRQPRWAADALGGRGALRFDGVDDRLGHAYNAFGPGETSGFTVAAVFATTSELGLLVGSGVAPPDVVGDYGAGLVVRDGLLVAKAANGPLGLRIPHPTRVDDGATHVGLARLTDSELEVRVDGVGALLRGRVNITPISTSAMGGVVADPSGATAVPLGVDVGEVRLYRYALDSCAIASVEAELAATWGVTVP